jgi:hypothetical protein
MVCFALRPDAAPLGLGAHQHGNCRTPGSPFCGKNTIHLIITAFLQIAIDVGDVLAG